MPVVHLGHSSTGTTVTWISSTNRTYLVAFKNNLDDAQWTVLKRGIPSAGSITSWLDSSTNTQRFYAVAQTN